MNKKSTKSSKSTKSAEDCDNVFNPPVVDVSTVAGQFDVLATQLGLPKVEVIDIILRINNYTNVNEEIDALLADAENGICFTGDNTAVTEQCGEDCCVGTTACTWEGNATVCVGSCNGEKACDQLRTGATILPFSCTGTQACDQIGLDGAGPVSVGPKSCNTNGGTLSCHRTGINAASIDIGYGACNDREACTTSDSGNSGALVVGDYSCNGGTSSCFSIRAAGDVTIMPRSCVDANACNGIGSPSNSNSVTIGESTCLGANACNAIGKAASAVSVGDRTCVGDFACNSIGNFALGIVDIGSDACIGVSTCNGMGRGVGATADPPKDVFIGDNSCTQDRICLNFGRNIDVAGADVTIPPDVCTDSTVDVCSTDTNIGGNAACSGSACMTAGQSFIMVDPPTASAACDFCDPK